MKSKTNLMSNFITICLLLLIGGTISTLAFGWQAFLFYLVLWYCILVIMAWIERRQYRKLDRARTEERGEEYNAYC